MGPESIFTDAVRLRVARPRRVVVFAARVGYHDARIAGTVKRL
jgi:hypothetical protein